MTSKDSLFAKQAYRLPGDPQCTLTSLSLWMHDVKADTSLAILISFREAGTAQAQGGSAAQ